MYDFDKPFVNDKRWGSHKWNGCKEGEIPMFVAVMDFDMAPPIMDALYERMKFPSFGYDDSAEAVAVLVEHYENKYGLHIERDWLMHFISVLPGANAALRAVGGGMMYCTPMYSCIRKLPAETGLPCVEVPMKLCDGRYCFDFEAMERAYSPEITSFILCNPHNPLGRVFTKEELRELVGWCKSHELTIISDEIHCELVLEGEHTPLFACCGEAMENTVTLSSPNKMCNMPGIPMAYALIPDKALRERVFKASNYAFKGESLNAAAFTAAYNGSCDEWKAEVLDYLRANRDYMEQRIAAIEGLSVNHNEGTYLAWLDCRALGLEEPGAFFREKAGVIMNSGAEFGDVQFTRLNFGCPRAQLKEALDRIEEAVTELRE